MLNLKYKNKWLICLTASLFFFYLAMLMNIYNPIAKEVLIDLHINAKEYGMISASYLLANVLFLIPAGLLCEVFCVRKLLIFATLLSSIFTYLFSIANSLTEAITINFLLGITGTVCFIVPIKLVKQWFSQKYYSSVIGMVLFFVMLGGMFSNLIFTWTTSIYNWRTSLIILSIIAMTIFILEWLFVFEKTNTNSPINIKLKQTFIEYKKDKYNVILVVLSGIFNSLMNLPLTILGAVWGILFLTKLYHLTSYQAATTTSLLFIGMAIGSLLFGYLSDKLLNREKLMMAGSIFSLLLFLHLRMIDDQNLMLLMLTFFMIGFMSGTQTLGYTITAEISSRYTASINTSITSVIVMLGGTLMQPLYGIILDISGKQTQIDNNFTAFNQVGFIHTFSVFYIGYILSLFIALYFYSYFKKIKNKENKLRNKNV